LGDEGDKSNGDKQPSGKAKAKKLKKGAKLCR
jgi:hypothetical protein